MNIFRAFQIHKKRSIFPYLSCNLNFYSFFLSSQMKWLLKSHWDSNIGESKQWKPIWTKVKNWWFWTKQQSKSVGNPIFGSKFVPIIDSSSFSLSSPASAELHINRLWRWWHQHMHIRINKLPNTHTRTSEHVNRRTHSHRRNVSPCGHIHIVVSFPRWCCCHYDF